MKKLILASLTLLFSWTLSVGQTFIVNDAGGDCNAWWFDTNNDSSPLSGTLQEAIYRQNNGGNFDNIDITIASKSCGSPQYVITSGNVIIDGQETFDFTATGGGTFFEVNTTSVTIQGISFSGGENAVLIKGNKNSVLKSSFDNPNNTGIQIDGNRDDIEISEVVISGSNKFGIQFNNFNGEDANVNNVEISSSEGDGILVTGNHSGLTIKDSYIYGNGQAGIKIDGGTGVVLSGNVIGLNKDGIKDANAHLNDISRDSWNNTGNVAGLIVHQALSLVNSLSFEIIGNTVSGNNGHGIDIENSRNPSSSPGKITGNKVGVNLTADDVIGNVGQGIYLDGVNYIDIRDNHISGNGNGHIFEQDDQISYPNMMGVAIYSIGDSYNVGVYGNLLGTDATGNAFEVGNVHFGNHHEAIHFNRTSWSIIGGRLESERNVIGGNGYGLSHVLTTTELPDGSYEYARFHGVTIANGGGGNTEGNKILGNYIGVGKDLVSNISNARDQISIQGYDPSGGFTTLTEIGGNNILDANYLAGGEKGVNIAGSKAQKTTVINNYFGISDMDGTPTVISSDAAININGSSDNQIGEVGKPNYIFNHPQAVMVDGSSTFGNTIVGNVMKQNTNDGILLINGANEGYGPVTVNLASITDNVVHVLSPNIGDRIDIYVADVENGVGPCQGADNNHQGAIWVGSESTVDVLGFYTDTDDGEGYVEIDLSKYTSDGITGDNIIVTGTDSKGNTSEFNTCITKVPCYAPTSISFDGTSRESQICDGSTTTIDFVVSWPSAEIGETHQYNLYKSPDYDNPVASILDGGDAGGSFEVTEAGWYRISGFNEVSEDFCGAITVDSFEVQVGELPTTGNISQQVPGDICANQDGVVYEVTDFEPGATFKWTVSGATTVGDLDGSSITINFGPISPVTIEVFEISAPPFSCNASDTSTLVIDVNPLPAPSISGENKVCDLDTVVYTANGTANSSFEWIVEEFVDTTAISSTELEVVWGLADGKVKVIETTNKGCVDSSAVSNIVSTTLPGELTLTYDSAICSLDTVTVAIESPATGSSYTWEIDGADITNATGTSNTLISNTGADSIIVRIMEEDAQECNSLLPTEIAIVLDSLPTPTDLLATNNTPCTESTVDVSFTSSRANSAAIWGAEPASVLPGDVSNPVTLNLAGITGEVKIWVREADIDKQCVSSASLVDTISINVKELPVLTDIIGLDSTTCDTAGIVYSVNGTVAEPAVYSWRFNNADFDSTNTDENASSIIVDFASINPASIWVSVVDSFGCSTVGEINKEVRLKGCAITPQPNVEDTTDYCLGETVTFKHIGDTRSGVTFEWDFNFEGDPLYDPTPSSFSGDGTEEIDVTYDSIGTYNVLVEAYEGAILLGADTVTVIIKELPEIASLTGLGDTICEGGIDSILVTSPTNGMLSWPRNSLVNATILAEREEGKNVLVNYGNDNAKLVVVENLNGCIDSLEINSEIINHPKAGVVSGDDLTCQADSVLLTYSGIGDDYIWSANNSAIVNDSANQAYVTLLGSDTTLVSVYVSLDSIVGLDTLTCVDMTNEVATYKIFSTQLPNTPEIKGDTLVCREEESAFAVLPDPGVVFTWSYLDSTVTGESATFTITQDTLVWVTSSRNGCAGGYDSLEVRMKPEPIADWVDGYDSVFCQLDTGRFEIDKMGQTESTFEWSVINPLTKLAYLEGDTAAAFVWGPNEDTLTVVQDLDGCTKTLLIPIEINNFAVGASIVANNSINCQFDTGSYSLQGALQGSTVIWTVDVEDTIVSSPIDALDIEVFHRGIGKREIKASEVTLAGCVNPVQTELPIYSSTINKIPETPEIVGTDTTCVDFTETFNVYISGTDSVEAGVEYIWRIDGDTLNGDQISYSWCTRCDGRKQIRVKGINGVCESVVSDTLIDVKALPTLPTIIVDSLSYCEDSIVTAKLNSSDLDGDYYYYWSVSQLKEKDFITDTLEGKRGEVDSIKFYVPIKEEWLGNDDPYLTINIEVGYDTVYTKLKGCLDDHGINTDVEYRISKADPFEISLIGIDNVHDAQCNMLDGRMDSLGMAVVDWQFKHADTITGNQGTGHDIDFLNPFAWEYFNVDKDGIKATYGDFEDYIDSSSVKKDTIYFNWRKLPVATVNEALNLHFAVQAESYLCNADIAEDTVNTEFEKSIEVEYALFQNLEACEGDTLSIGVRNNLNELDSMVNYTWYHNGYAFNTNYTIEKDVVTEEEYGNFVFDYTVGDSSLYTGDTSRSYRANEMFQVGKEIYRDEMNVSGLGVSGFDYFQYAEANFGDTMIVIADPEYCAVINGEEDPKLVAVWASEIVSYPGGSIMGAITGEIRNDDGQRIYTKDQIKFEGFTEFEDSLTLSQLEDEFVLYDLDEINDARDTNSTEFVYPRFNHSVAYNWSWVVSEDSSSTLGLIPDTLMSVTPQMTGNKEELITYMMVTSQYNYPLNVPSAVKLCSDTTYYDVHINYLPWVPNAFSPNGDNDHDLFKIRNVEKFPGTSVTIYNRWGSELIKISDYDNVNNVWDGKINNKDAATGTYYYIVNFGDNGIGEMSGSISIIR